MKIEPEVGQTWQNKRNGTRVTITGIVPHSSSRGDWDKSIAYVSHRGHVGNSFYPNFHGRFEIIEEGGQLPVDAALTKPLNEWPLDFLRRLLEATEKSILARQGDGA